MQTAPAAQAQPAAPESRTKRLSSYEQWIRSAGIPIHRGYYIEDGRTVEVGEWAERGCKAAFLVLAGNEGIAEFRITELAPGQTLPPFSFAMDELVYVLAGRGLTTIWAGDGPQKSFEWDRRSIFELPRGATYQLSNTQGNAPVRLLQYNYLPQAMHVQPDPAFYFNSGYQCAPLLYSEENPFSTAKALPSSNERQRALGRPMWTGNFFPDMGVWDKLDIYPERGAGGFHMAFQIPESSFNGHMSAFPSLTYKKAHRHGPGTMIVIPGGEGFSYMWIEGTEKMYIPWHEASIFVPPNSWFHQHFNVGAEPARYVAFHGNQGYRETVTDLANDQIEYVAEDPLVRATFERELAKRGLRSDMPAACYTDPTYQFAYEGDD